MFSQTKGAALETPSIESRIPHPRAGFWSLLVFFLIAWGLGYPILNRYDPRQIPGLSDVKTYSAMVLGEANPGYGHVQSRVLVPWLARPFYWFANGRLGSWDPVLFGLLAADSIFVALTATLIVIIGTRMLSNYILGLVASLLYLLNFCIPNLRLTGLVDASEGFSFLLSFSGSRSPLSGCYPLLQCWERQAKNPLCRLASRSRLHGGL